MTEFQKLISTVLRVVPVDEAFYLARNPDVAEGIKAGVLVSARQHFLDHGYFEGRMPFPIAVDEQWYLTTHPDVAETVVRGEYESAQVHFDGPGYSEGREPFADKA